MEREPTKVPGLLLERLHAGDLPPEKVSELERRLAREPGGADRLRALADDDAATLASLSPARVAARVLEASGRRVGPRIRPGWLLAPAVAAASLAILLVRQDGRAPLEEGAGDVTAVKGMAAHLVIHRDTGAGAELLAPGASARSGDLVQIGYVAAGAPYGVILSIDGRGEVSRHWPTSGEAAGALTAQREVLLPESFRLDDAPTFERFFLITSESAFPVEEALRAARALAGHRDASTGTLPIGPGRAATSVLIQKEAR